MLRVAALALGLTLSLSAKTPKQDVLATSTDRVEFVAGGTIRIEGSMDELDIEGWDQPAVEITLTRSVWHNAPTDATGRMLSHVQMKATRKAADELDLTTVVPTHNILIRPLLGKTPVTLQYVLRVPRASHLIVHHGTGDVRLSGLTGTIEASIRAGDLEMRLTDPNSFAIDAKCDVGGVSSDFDGPHGGHYLLGERFDVRNQPSAPRALLRVGIGGIQILKADTAFAAAQ